MRLSKKASYGLDYTAMQFSPQGWGRLNKFVYSYFYSVINIHLQKLKGGEDTLLSQGVIHRQGHFVTVNKLVKRGILRILE